MSLIMTGPWEELAVEEEEAQAKAPSVRVRRSATADKKSASSAASKKDAPEEEEKVEKPGFWSRWV